LCDADDDLRCDFELLTDELASGAGLLRSQIAEPSLADELLWVSELIYHMNPTLRTTFTVMQEEIARLAAAVDRLQAESNVHGFVLPCGCQCACTAHLLRVKAKCLVRLLYRYRQRPGRAFRSFQSALGLFLFACAEMQRHGRGGRADLPQSELQINLNRDSIHFNFTSAALFVRIGLWTERGMESAYRKSVDRRMGIYGLQGDSV